jgi:mono/diheme cytochrome c family protein
MPSPAGPARLAGWEALLATILIASPIHAGDPAFQPTVQRILARNCAGCHNSVDRQGGLDLEPDHAFANLVGVKSIESPLPRVMPGDPERSYLVRKLTGTQAEAGGEGAQMPANGAALPGAQIDVIRHWIEAGASKGPS